MPGTRSDRLPFLAAMMVFCLLHALPALAGGSCWQVVNQGSGLPSNKTTAFATSGKQMAVGTDVGIGLYDPVTALWAPLPLPDQVASCEIRDLAYDGNHQLWVATPHGIAHVQDGSIEVFGVADGLPNIDVERIQVAGPDLYVGCFGGFICKALIPQNGRTTFTAVNYDPNEREDSLRLRSVGVTALAMKDGSRGFFSTKGAGLYEVQGRACLPAERSGDLPSEWVETFTIFEGKSRQEYLMIGTSSGLSLMVDGHVREADVLPQAGLWMTGLVTGTAEPMLPVPRNLSENDRKLREFLGKRYLWISTREHGLWRFQDGRWTQFLPENSQLPSRTVHRLFKVGRRIVACTDAGLVIIPLLPFEYDEFKGRGLGSRYMLTLYPGPDLQKYMCPVNHIVRGTDLWVATEKGLCRFVGVSGVSEALMRFSPEMTSAREDPDKPADEDEAAGARPVAKGGERKWQIFKKDPTLLFYTDGVTWPIYSNDVTAIVVDRSDHPWMVFERKLLARLRMVPRRKKSDETDERLEDPAWDYINKSQPWPGDTKLNALWMDEDKLFVGTKGWGFYVLGNPGYVGPDEAKFDWKNYGDLEGLRNLNVIGFARRRTQQGSEIALLHPDGLTLWNGKDFVPIDLGGRRTYSCISGDALGNLWLGSDGGLFRVTPDLRVVSFTTGNAFLESDRITAVAASNDTAEGGGYAVWVACDQSPAGSDQPPNVVKRGDKKVVLEMDIAGSSLHFFDGHDWDKWKVAGVRCMLLEGDYLFLGTNIRMRRLNVPMNKMKTEDWRNVTSDKVYGQEARGAADGLPASQLGGPDGADGDGGAAGAADDGPVGQDEGSENRELGPVPGE
ncbi:MAG: hypothetical protein GX442_10855 [Candidatus Riflebacteria bacterium]|nr:hypothetical protein [Candidatus Riflebacteria bacterium]